MGRREVLWLCPVVAWGCSADVPAAPSDPLEKYQTHLLVYDEGKTPIPTVLVDYPESQSTVKGGPHAKITSADPLDLQFSGTAPSKLDVGFDDPFGARPGLCYSMCTKQNKCFRKATCIESLADGITSGVFRSFLGFSAAPAEDQELDLYVRPISSLSGAPPIAIMNAGDANKISADIVIGQGLQLPVQIQGTGGAGGTGGGGGSGGSGNVGGGGGSGGGVQQGSPCSTKAQCGSLECVSTRNCLMSMDKICTCSGSSSGACYPITSACNAPGGPCGASTKACCPGNVCVDGLCYADSSLQSLCTGGVKG